MLTNYVSLKRLLRIATILTVLIVPTIFVGCAQKDYDETASWSQNKLLNEAKSSLADSDYPNCVKYFEKLESRYPFGPLAEQAQINSAYCNWKRNEQELA